MRIFLWKTSCFMSRGTNGAVFPADLQLVTFLLYKKINIISGHLLMPFVTFSSQDSLLPFLFLIYLSLCCAQIGLELFTVGRHETFNQLAGIRMKRSFLFLSCLSVDQEQNLLRSPALWVKLVNILRNYSRRTDLWSKKFKQKSHYSPSTPNPCMS